MLALRCYSTLGVARNASCADIRSAYRRGALRCHPDKGGTDEAFRSLVQAFETLINSESRKEYDRALVSACSTDGCGPVPNCCSTNGLSSAANSRVLPPKKPKRSAAATQNAKTSSGVLDRKQGLFSRHSTQTHDQSSHEKGTNGDHIFRNADKQKAASNADENRDDCDGKPFGTSGASTSSQNMESGDHFEDRIVATACSDFDVPKMLEQFLQECPSRWRCKLTALHNLQLRLLKEYVSKVLKEHKAPKKEKRVDLLRANTSSEEWRSIDRGSSASSGTLALAGEMNHSIIEIDECASRSCSVELPMLCDKSAETESAHADSASTVAGVDKHRSSSGASPQHTANRMRSAHTKHMPGIYKKGNGYQACVEIWNFAMLSNIADSLDGAITFHIILTEIRASIANAIKRVPPVSFDEAVRDAVSSCSDTILDEGMKISFFSRVWSPTMQGKLTTYYSDMEYVLQKRRLLIAISSASRSIITEEVLKIREDARLRRATLAKESRAALSQKRLEARARRAQMREQARAKRQEKADAKRFLQLIRKQRRKEAKQRYVMELRAARARKRLLSQLLLALRQELCSRASSSKSAAIAANRQKRQAKMQAAEKRQAKKQEAAAAKKTRQNEEKVMRNEKKAQLRLEKSLHREGYLSLPRDVNYSSEEHMFFAVFHVPGCMHELEAPHRSSIEEAEIDSIALQSAFAAGGKEAAISKLTNLEIQAFSIDYGTPWDSTSAI